MISFYGLLFSACFILWYFLFWIELIEKINCKNNLRTRKRIFICFCWGQGTTKCFHLRLQDQARVSLLLAHLFSEGIALFRLCSWVGNDFFLMIFEVCPFAPGVSPNHSSILQLFLWIDKYPLGKSSFLCWSWSEF